MKEFFKKVNIKRALKYALYMFLALVCQDMLFTQMRIAGVCPMFLPAVAIAVGMFEGASWGAVFGLIMGVFADMAFVENTILFTVLFPALSFMAGFVAHFFLNRRFFAFMVAASAGILATALVQMFGVASAEGFSSVMLTTALLQTLWSLPPAALAYFPPAKWIE